MRILITAFAAIYVLSGTFAMAQGSHALRTDANTTTRHAIHAVPAMHSQIGAQIGAPAVRPAASNGTGINRLGVTTNSGRMYNGG